MIEIRRATEADAQTLTDLGKTTFIETFANDNTQEDMDSYVAKTFGADKQLSEIKDPNRFIEIAWVHGKAAGFLHLLSGSPDPSVKGPKPIEILRLYVDSQWHGKGVGAALMDRAIALARSHNFETLWLGVWEHNQRAQTFYRKYGFEVVGDHIFKLGNDEQTDLIMSRNL